MSFLGKLLARMGYMKRSECEAGVGLDGRIPSAGPITSAPEPVTPALGAAPALTAAGAATPWSLDDAESELDELTEVELTEVWVDDDDEWEWQAAAARARVAAEATQRAARLVRPAPPPVPKRRFAAIVPPLGEPLPARSARAATLKPLPQIGVGRRPATAPVAPRPVVVIPPLSAAPMPAPPRRMAHGTAPVERDDTGPNPTFAAPARSAASREHSAPIELLDLDEVAFDDLQH